MNTISNIILLSISPISELRGAMLYAVANNFNIFLAFIISVLANSLVIPITFFFLDYLHKHFLKIKAYKKIFNNYIENKRRSFEKHVGTNFEFWALVIFVGIPLPLTGAYSGTLLAWFFNLKRRRSYLAIFIGILLAGIILTLISFGIKDLF